MRLVDLRTCCPVYRRMLHNIAWTISIEVWGVMSPASGVRREKKSCKVVARNGVMIILKKPGTKRYNVMGMGIRQPPPNKIIPIRATAT
jgi:hypothetical protein